MKKYEKFNQIVKEYFNSYSSSNLRFGQWFINNYVDNDSLPWPELFYEENLKKSIDMAYQHIMDLYQQLDEEE